MKKDNIKVVKVDTDPAKKSLKDLRNELKAFKDEMANLEEGSDEFLKVANKAGEVKHQLDEINESVKGASSDFGDLIGNITNVAAGITGAFQAVAGGLQAMGVESEAVDQAIAKMQGLMAVTQGLSAIDDGVKSFAKLTKSINLGSKSLNGFKKALIGTGLGALVVVLGSIIANWDEFTKAIGISEEALEKFGNKAKGVLNSVKEMFSGIGKGIVKFITGDFSGAKEAFEQGFSFAENFQAGVEKAEDENEKNRLQKAKENFEKEYAIRKERINRIDDEVEKQKELLKLEKEYLGYLDEGTLDYEKQLTTIKNINKELENAIELEIKRRKEEGGLDINEYRPKTNTDNIPADATPMTLDKALSKVKPEKQQFIEEIGEIEESFNKLFDGITKTISSFGDSSLGINTEWINSLNVFQDAFKQTMQIIKEDGTAGWEQYAQVAATALNGVGSLLNNLSKEQDASTPEGFEKMKKFQIAATVMNMLSGIMSAWTSAMSPTNAWMTLPGQIALGTSTSALVAGIGAAQIAKIKSQTMESSNPNTNINAKTISSMIIPPVQYSNAVQNASIEGAIGDTKVYVTESDITGTINKVNVQENENRY